MAPAGKLQPSAATGVYHSDTATDNAELTKILNEGIETFNHGLRQGKVTQPFVSIAQDYQSANNAPVAQMTTTPVDLSQKYRRVKPALQIPISGTTPAGHADMSNTQVPAEPLQQDLSPSRSPSRPSPLPTLTSSPKPPPSHISRKRRNEEGEEEYQSNPSTEESDVELSKKKAYGKGPKGQKAKGAPLKTKAPSKSTKKHQRKEADKINTNKDDFDAQEKRLKESRAFEPTSAFKKKAGVVVSGEEKRLVGIHDQEDAKPPAKKRRRRRPKAADWDAEYPNTTSEVPEDGGLDDEQLISIGMDDGYSIKTRWAKAPYVWNKKGLLYKQYQYLAGLRDNLANFKWPDKVAKAFLGMNRDTWIRIQKNGGFFTAKGVPRQRKQKSLIPERESNGKFKAVQAASQEARELSKATRYEILYNRLLEPGSTTMKRMRNTRKRTEALIEETVESNVATQKWGKEMADAWHQANKDLLLFKEAAINRIMELEEQITQFTTVANQSPSPSSTPTPTPTPTNRSAPPSPTLSEIIKRESETINSPRAPAKSPYPFSDGLSNNEGPLSLDHEKLVAGGLEATEV